MYRPIDFWVFPQRTNGMKKMTADEKQKFVEALGSIRQYAKLLITPIKEGEYPISLGRTLKHEALAAFEFLKSKKRDGLVEMEFMRTFEASSDRHLIERLAYRVWRNQ